MLRKALIASARAASSPAVRFPSTFSRMLSSSAVLRKATIFDMPAMSPTMTEGGIVEWQVKAGDEFVAGDVLLEIETDKAQISVEAQDDGIMAKIIVENGATGVKVGSPIAVLAELEDDVSKIDYDSLLAKGGSSSAPAPAAEKSEAAPEKSEASSSASAAPAAPAPESGHSSKSNASLPSVLRLIHANNLSADGIVGTGPNGRITKGDVLAKLGKINSDLPAAEAARITKRQHLDLSHVKAEAKPAAAAAAAESKPTKAAKPAPEPAVIVEMLPLAGLLEVSGELGFSLPRAINKAIRLATRDSIIAGKPRPSVLRNKALDALTSPAKKLAYQHDIRIVKNKSVVESLEVKLTVPVNRFKDGELQANVFLGRLSYYLGEGAGELLI